MCRAGIADAEGWRRASPAAHRRRCFVRFGQRLPAKGCPCSSCAWCRLVETPSDMSAASLSRTAQGKARNAAGTALLRLSQAARDGASIMEFLLETGRGRHAYR